MHASATRVEDLRLITGHGKFAADWTLPGQLYAAFLRADRAQALACEARFVREVLPALRT